MGSVGYASCGAISGKIVPSSSNSTIHHLYPSHFLVKRNEPGMMKFFVMLKEFLFYIKMDLLKINFFIHHYHLFMWNIQISQCLPVAGATFVISDQPILYACVHTGMVVCKQKRCRLGEQELIKYAFMWHWVM